MKFNPPKSKRPTKSMTKLDLPPGYRAHSFVRTRDNFDIGLLPVDQGIGWEFALDQVPDVAEFTNLFDAFCIDKVDITFALRDNQADKFPILVLAPDYDDASAPLTEDAVLTAENCEIVPFSAVKRHHTVTLTPRVAVATYRPGISTGYSWGKSSTVVDMGATNTPHYGLKTWLLNYNSTNTPGATIRVFMRIHFRCIGVR